MANALSEDLKGLGKSEARARIIQYLAGGHGEKSTLVDAIINQFDLKANSPTELADMVLNKVHSFKPGE